MISVCEPYNNVRLRFKHTGVQLFPERPLIKLRS
jgi:hypothetical protein